MGVYCRAGYFHWWCGGGAGNNSDTGSHVADRLECVVIARDDTGAGKLYINGELADTTSGKTWGTPNPSSVIQFWGYYITAIYPYEGYVGMTALWGNRTLSAADVKLLYREPYCMFEERSPVPSFGPIIPFDGIRPRRVFDLAYRERYKYDDFLIRSRVHD
jgi:hypothetical protein